MRPPAPSARPARGAHRLLPHPGDRLSGLGSTPRTASGTSPPSAARFLYGPGGGLRLLPGAGPARLRESALPDQPPALREADFYTWDPRSPQWTFTPPAGQSRDGRGARLQPADPAASADRLRRGGQPGFWYGFSPVRGAGPEKVLNRLPAVPHLHPARPAGLRLDRRARIHRSRAAAWPGRFPHRLRTLVLPARAVFAPGWCWPWPPWSSAGAADRTKASRDACLLFTASAVLVLVPPAAFATFDWRYQLPQLTLIPVAAILAVNVIISRLNGRHPKRETSLPEADGQALPAGAPGTPAAVYCCSDCHRR